jgi:hypothetical protein
MCRLHVGKQMAWRVSLRPNGEHTAFREGFLKWKKHELFKYSDRELKEADRLKIYRRGRKIAKCDFREG